jgi:IS5 family transposase
VENPYWKFFCGETYPQTELPIDPSSLMRRGKRIGEEGIETLLPASDAARRGGVVHKSSMQQLIVDTTVMPKAIAIPPTCWTSAASIWLCRDSGLL